MTHHVTVRPTDEGDKFVVVEVTPNQPDSRPEREYGRLDAAVAKAWTLARKARIPLMINIHPGRPTSVPTDERQDIA